MSENKAVLEDFIRSAVNRDSDGGADTMLLNAHLSQMKMFGIRQGVEFYPNQDNFGTQRFDFIQQVIKFNKLDARLDSIWDRFLAYGKGLFYIRPTKKTYRLYWFDRDAYRTYYTPEGDLEEVIIIYPYKVKSSRGFGGVGLATDKRYMRLRITSTEIQECHSEQELSFDTEVEYATTGNTTTTANTMEFIPCVEVFNNPDAFGTDGHGEFGGCQIKLLPMMRWLKTSGQTSPSLGTLPYCLLDQNKTLLRKQTVMFPNVPAFPASLGSNLSSVFPVLPINLIT